MLTFVASGLDIYGCVLSYFDGTVNLQMLYRLYTDYFALCRGVLSSVLSSEKILMLTEM